MKNAKLSAKDFEEKAKHISSFMEQNPFEAIQEARNLGNDVNSRALKAAIFIDAGSMIKDIETIKSGINILEKLHSSFPDNPSIAFNLANGHHGLARSSPYSDMWHKDTQASRKRAKNLFYKAARSSGVDLGIKSGSYCNLGNVLADSYRWVEAYDFYKSSIQYDRLNGVAISGAIRMLRFALANSTGDENAIKEEITYLASEAAASDEKTKEYAGTNGANTIKEDLSKIPQKERKASKANSDDFKRFVSENTLHLSPTIHSCKFNERRWDNLNISYLISEIQADIPEPFVMLNIIKSDYILARQLLYKAIHKEFSETGSYSDSLDYACYGVNESALLLAQRAALDILDKIAVASLAYLNIAGAAGTNFRKCWFKNSNDTQESKDAKDLHPTISEEISKGNTALVALSEISFDLAANAFLGSKQIKRNAATHRFSVLHDVGLSAKSTSKCVEHYAHDDFVADAISTMKHVRSAIIYFVEMINIREKRKQEEHADANILIASSEVPWHHYIRGEER